MLAPEHGEEVLVKEGTPSGPVVGSVSRYGILILNAVDIEGFDKSLYAIVPAALGFHFPLADEEIVDFFIGCRVVEEVGENVFCIGHAGT